MSTAAAWDGVQVAKRSGSMYSRHRASTAKVPRPGEATGVTENSAAAR
jgi:hypothetical protein